MWRFVVGGLVLLAALVLIAIHGDNQFLYKQCAAIKVGVRRNAPLVHCTKPGWP